MDSMNKKVVGITLVVPLGILVVPGTVLPRVRVGPLYLFAGAMIYRRDDD